MDDGPRKRSRTSGASSSSTATRPNLSPPPPPSQRLESSDDRVRASQLRDPKQRLKALNAILKLSSSHEANYALSGDSVLQSLLHIAMECMEWPELVAPGQDTAEAIFSSARAWHDPPT
eukprot:CAMPEP_0172464154 /NCGR_PEP_ID=MMETSP1065-20121228/49542_1 /TAXON_ID=265537 /ORGANISM="Amphiprora paludosa, Strain CCMP125" /LENGTH=118 /DNA_ID=CAMNT_0013220313 /DNA_START=74 /DNA_END=426 /DNA_ORIENTATION=+